MAAYFIMSNNRKAVYPISLNEDIPRMNMILNNADVHIWKVLEVCENYII